MRDSQQVPQASPTFRTRRLGKELRTLRMQAGLTLDDVGQKIGKTGAAISKVELGQNRINGGGVMELLTAYGLTPEDKKWDELVAMARSRREEGWWQRLDFPPRFGTYLSYESEAAEVAQYDPLLVPGLLQTEAYARAIISAGPFTDEGRISELVEVRMRRQARLKTAPRLRVHALIFESALMVEVGGRAVLRDQLAHLAAVAELPNVRLQVLRFAAGATAAGHAGFQVLTFDDVEPPLGFIETIAGGLFLESASDIARVSTVFDDLKMLALSPQETIHYIQERYRATNLEEVHP